MRRYGRIYKTFFTSSLARELEFRANFIAKIFENLVWAAYFAIIVQILFLHTNEIAGWSRGEAFVLTSTVFFLMSVFSASFMSLHEIPEQVRKGTLDFVLTKPVDTQFAVSVRKFNFSQMGSIIGGFAMLGYGLSQAGVSPRPLDVAGYIVGVLCAIVIYYNIQVIMMTLGIYFVRVDNLWVLGDTMTDVARFPIDIYSIAAQRVLMYFLPLALLGTIPAIQITRGFTWLNFGLSIGWAVFLAIWARWFWNYSLRHYSSASS